MRPFHAGASVASSIPGNRRTSAGTASAPSSRASADPRQWWMPLPNDRWPLAPSRPRSSSGGCRAPLVLVAVRRPEQGEHELAGLDVLAGELDVGGDDAPRDLDRAVVAQQLVDRVGVERGVGHEALELVAVAEQGERAVADEVDGRLVPGQVQQDDLVAQLDRA